MVGRRPRGLLGVDLALLRHPGHALRRGAGRPRRCPERAGSRARGSTTPSTRCARATATRAGAWSSVDEDGPRAASCAGTSCARRSAARGRRAARARHRPRRPGGRLPAQLRRGGRSPTWPCASIGAVWSSCAPDLAARRRAGPLRPAAPGGADRVRRLPLRRPRRTTGAPRWPSSRGALPALRTPVVDREPARRRRAAGAPSRGRRWRRRRRSRCSSPSPSTTRSTCSSRRAPPGRPRGSCTATAGSCSTTSATTRCTSTSARPTASSSTRTRAGWSGTGSSPACSSGSTIVLYDGSPRHPELDAQFAVAARDRGHGARHERRLPDRVREGRPRPPARRHDLGALRAIASTGSPLPPETFHWIHEAVGEHVWPISTSGGTDVCSAFVGGSPLLPVRAGEIQCRCLGAAIDVLDEDGRPLRDEVGELVLTAPLPSMPVALLERPRRRALPRELLRPTTPASGATATGPRSPTTARSSSSAARTRRSTATACASARPRSTPRSTRCPRSPTASSSASSSPTAATGCRSSSPWSRRRDLDDELRAEILERDPHRPPRRATCPTRSCRSPPIPRTLTGKKLEVPIKRLFMGADPATTLNRNAVADPAALDAFVELAGERASRRPS